MSFATEAAKSKSSPRIIVELSYYNASDGWVNAGAFIWKVNMFNSYPELTAPLASGLTTLGYYNVNSVKVDSAFYAQVPTLPDLASSEGFFWDDAANDLYVRFTADIEPWFFSSILLGVARGFSDESFTPIGSSFAYDGRLASISSVERSRDPLFFGKLSFPSMNATFHNADGEFDLSGENLELYGSPFTIKIGYAELDISEYQQLYKGYVTSLNIDEEKLAVTVDDPRKQLTRPYNYTCTAQNALSAISSILVGAYGISYSSTYFDLTAWNAAAASAETVSMNITDSSMSVSDIIELVCTSVFGYFDITTDGLYSFKMVDTSASSVTTIRHTDVLDEMNSISYDPTEVISSIRISYNRDFSKGISTDRTWLTNTDYESTVYSSYRTYNQRDFNTVLASATAASVLSTRIMDYVKSVHGTLQVTVPMAYYALEVGDNVDIEVWRETVAMLGTKKCEILSKSYNLNDNNISLTLRII